MIFMLRPFPTETRMIIAINYEISKTHTKKRDSADCRADKKYLWNHK